MFEGLNAIPWADLHHAYGSAEEVPVWLRQLASDDEQVRHQAIGHLGGSLCHEGFLCLATAYAVPYLIELLQEPSVRGKDEILSLLSWIARADPIEEWPLRKRAVRPPEPVPLKDAHAVAGAGIPTYAALLDAPELNVRMEAASLLMRFPEHARELWPVLQAAWEREETEQGRINLAFALSIIGRRLPEQQAFFVEQFQTSQHELIVFAAALALAWLAKAETPEEVAQLLARVALEPPASLNAYQEIPCGYGSAGRAALHALCNLGSARLQFLAPLLEERLASSERAYSMSALGMLLLFIVFGEEAQADFMPPPEEALTQQHQQLYTHWLLRYIIFGKQMKTSQSPRPATALTERQRKALLLVLPWCSGDLGELLEAYGLPDRREELAAYLGLELPPPTPRQAPRSRPAGPPRQDWTMLAIARVRAVYPDLKGGWQRWRPDEVGQEEDGLTLHNEMYFRFPMQAASIEKLEQEIALLRALQERLPLPILTPEYSSWDVREAGHVFVGYALPPGKKLSKEMVESIDDEETVQRLPDELASFLDALHHIPIADHAPFPLREITKRETLEALYTRVREDLIPQMPLERQEQIAASFEVFLDTPGNFAVPPTLIHGIFGPETIFYHAKTRRISGISGFSRAGLGDPARDVGGLLGPRGYGEDFVQRFIRHYPEAAALLGRARFYAEVHALEGQLRRLSAVRRGIQYQPTIFL